MIQLESSSLLVEIAPEVGGRVVRIFNKPCNYDFLWRNPRLPLERLPVGTAYDPNFFGGIDELLPNDGPLATADLTLFDHGELWTTPLECNTLGGAARLFGRLPHAGLSYERTIRLRASEPVLDCDYTIGNITDRPVEFSWRMHAALRIEEGDLIECPAEVAQVADRAWSRFDSPEPFPWPRLHGTLVNVVPTPCGKCDFFDLLRLRAGHLAWRRPRNNLHFAYTFDLTVFPFATIFASYGGLDGHYTAILEPATSLSGPARKLLRLPPGAQLHTTVSIFAGVPS
ncbi:MAG: hypothetical protein IT425_11535 [Pirellulales bacterium]|nr:hypothetical protein [Pirellulales bacterium]